MPLPIPSPILPTTVAILGAAERFPVRRIYCVGRNYAAHAREMAADDREPPFFFTKFADTLVASGGVLPYPSATADFHHEAELVVAIGATARNVPVETALDHVYGYACGLDMTRRDIQAVAKDAGKPWDMAKNFTGAAAIAPIVATAAAGDLSAGPVALDVNGTPRQRGDLSEMIWSVAEIVARLSELDTLEPGDLIYTGTPAGVGALVPGDVLTLTIASLPPLTITIG